MFATYDHINFKISEFLMSHITLTEHIFFTLSLETGSHITLVITLERQVAAHIKLKDIISSAPHYMRQIRMQFAEIKLVAIDGLR